MVADIYETKVELNINIFLLCSFFLTGNIGI